MSNSIFENNDGLGLAALVAKGDVSPTELLDEAIERVEAADGVVGLLADRYYDFARKAIADGLPDGPFTGVPFMRKDDGADIEGLSATLGMKLLADEKAPVTRTQAQRYIDAGLVFFAAGKVPPGFVTYDSAGSAYGPVLNPWNTTLTAGGSSAGTGAVVAAGAIPMAHGSDGGGSLRIPAAWSGAYTMKPSRGRLPEGPVYTETWMGFATEGHITRSVRDNAALTDATMGIELGSRYDAPQPAMPYLETVQAECPPLRIAIQTTDNYGNAFHPHHAQAIDDTSALLAELGHQVTEAQPVLEMNALSESMYVCIAASVVEFTDMFGEQRGQPVTEDELEPIMRSFLRRGADVTGADYTRINTLSMEMAYTCAAFLQDYDVLVSPTLPGPAPLNGAVYEHENDLEALRHHQDAQLNMTMVANFTGQPAASVPLFHSPDDLPIGIQLSGRYGDESTLYALSAQLEQARPWWSRLPGWAL